MSQPTPLTDSPWFWLLVFASIGIAALVAISGQYGKRQARLDRQYQARERVTQGVDVVDRRNDDRRDFAAPNDTLIPLWPLAAGLGTLVVFAVVMLLRERRRRATVSRPSDSADVRANENSLPQEGRA